MPQRCADYWPMFQRAQMNSSAGERTVASRLIRSTKSRHAIRRHAAKDRELPLLEVLIQAGSNVNFQQNGKGDTPLIGAASLGAKEVGLKLLDAGARPELRGLFGETALHWAALLGEDRLAGRLIENVDPNLKDKNTNLLRWDGQSMPGAIRPRKTRLTARSGEAPRRRWSNS
jgi:ankyrin repeat protein